MGRNSELAMPIHVMKYIWESIGEGSSIIFFTCGLGRATSPTNSVTLPPYNGTSPTSSDSAPTRNGAYPFNKWYMQIIIKNITLHEPVSFDMHLLFTAYQAHTVSCTLSNHAMSINPFWPA